MAFSLLKSCRSTRSHLSNFSKTHKNDVKCPQLSPLSLHNGEKRGGRARERASGATFLTREREGEDGTEEVERRADISVLGIPSRVERERKRV